MGCIYMCTYILLSLQVGGGREGGGGVMQLGTVSLYCIVCISMCILIKGAWLEYPPPLPCTYSRVCIYVHMHCCKCSSQTHILFCSSFYSHHNPLWVFDVSYSCTSLIPPPALPLDFASVSHASSSLPLPALTPRLANLVAPLVSSSATGCLMARWRVNSVWGWKWGTILTT